LTTVAKEGVAFAETRKKDLVNFLKKLLKHPYLKTSPELNVFITSDSDFLNFKKKEESLNHVKEKGIFEKLTTAIHNVTKGKPQIPSEQPGNEGVIYNYSVNFTNLHKTLMDLSTSVSKLSH
jgi:hypothetical protein